jgi:hypothetical protein
MGDQDRPDGPRHSLGPQRCPACTSEPARPVRTREVVVDVADPAPVRRVTEVVEE